MFVVMGSGACAAATGVAAAVAPSASAAMSVRRPSRVRPADLRESANAAPLSMDRRIQGRVLVAPADAMAVKSRCPSPGRAVATRFPGGLDHPMRWLAGPLLRVARPLLEGGRGSLELDELELQPPVAGGREAHRVDGRAPALGRRARVEDVEAVALLVQRPVRVAEHDR